MSLVGRIGNELSEILWICCNPAAREFLDRPDVVARLAGDAKLFEHPVLPGKAPKLAGQPPADTLARRI